MTAPPETLPSRARAGFNDSVHGLVLSFTTNPGIIPLLKHEISGTVQWLPVLRRDFAITVVIFIIGPVLGLRSDLIIIGSNSSHHLSFQDPPAPLFCMLLLEGLELDCDD